MKVRVLGCHGGSAPGRRTTSFLIDGVLAVDAGATAEALSIHEQARLEAVVLSHSHMDHVKDLATVADNTFSLRKSALDVFATGGTLAHLTKHLFNDKLWPDFTKLPSKNHPTLRFRQLAVDRDLRIAKWSVRPIPVNHPVDTVGYVISDGNGSVAISGDTGPTKHLWEHLNKVDGLRAILLECSFPNEQQAIADVSGHLTPRTLATELTKYTGPEVPIFVYHLKPAFHDAIVRELSTAMPRAVRVLQLDDEFQF